MCLSFLWTVFTLLMPLGGVWALCVVRQGTCVFPLAAALSPGILALVAAVTVRAELAPAWSWVCTCALSTVALAAVVCRPSKSLGLRSGPFGFREVALCAAVAFLGTVDLPWIFSVQGVGVDGGANYFRPPLHNDNERHLVIVSSLLRGAENPLLTGSTLLYQTFWHGFAAVVIAPWEAVFQPLSLFELLSGHLWALGLYFSFLLLYFLRARFPHFLSARRWVFWLIVVFSFCHADLGHLMASFLSRGVLGIEADWSMTPRFFRSFSLKLVALTAPQHLFFGFALLAYWIRPAAWRREQERLGGWALGFMGLSSPLLTAFFLAVVLPVEWLRSQKRKHTALRLANHCLGAGCATFALFPSLFSFQAERLFLRPGTNQVFWFPEWSFRWFTLPGLWFFVFGVAGVLLTYALLRYTRRLPELAGFFVLGLVLHGVVTSGEIRRHYAVLVSLVLPWLLCATLHYLRRGRSRGPVTRWAVIGGLVALVCQGYFVFSYVAKPSKMAAHLPLENYLHFNRELVLRYPGLAALGASDPWGYGLEYPPVMQAASSFSLYDHAKIHAELSPQQQAILFAAPTPKEVLPRAAELGYHFLTCGPVESLLWGERATLRFCNPKYLLFSTAGVGLYLWNDAWHESTQSFLAGRAGAKEWLRRGLASEEEGWFNEAYSLLRSHRESHGESRSGNLALSRILLRYGDFSTAVHLHQRAEALPETFPERRSVAPAGNLLFPGKGPGKHTALP